MLVGKPAALQIPSNNPLTVEGWVYFRSVDSRDCLYSKNAVRGAPCTYMFGCIDSGGRIALVAREGANTGQLRFEASGGTPATRALGSAGTIYLKASSSTGALLVDNNNYVTTSTNWYTELPPKLNAEPAVLKDVTLEMRNQARAGILAANLRFRDLIQVDAGSRLHLLGQTVRIRSPYHAFSEGDEDEDGGQLIWQTPGTVLLVR